MQDIVETGKIRLDKWLWHARFFKTRTLAARVVKAGHVRVNGTRTGKPAAMVGAQDVLTFAQEREIRVIRIVAPGERRGPAPEARALYEDLSPPQPRSAGDSVAPNPAYDGKGRPTKKERRKLDLNRPGTLE